MKLLALEAATQACSAALWIDGEVYEKFEIAPRRQAEILLPMVERLMDERAAVLADLDAIAVGKGPGAFTGLRGVMGMAQGLGLSLNLPTVGVSNLECLAEGAFRLNPAARRCLVVQDARMGEVYWAVYMRPECAGPLELEGVESVSEPSVLPFETLDASTLIAGNAWDSIPELTGLSNRSASQVHMTHPHAEDIARLAVKALQTGRVGEAAGLEPAYIRNNVAKKSTKKAF